jgi:hypothetical protein
MENKDIYDDINSIKKIMERSSKFISLSGLSGILAGIYALIGVVIAWFLIRNNPTSLLNNNVLEALSNIMILFWGIVITALAVLLASIVTGCILSYRKAKRRGQSVWNTTSRLLLYNMIVPLLTGGIVIIILFYQGNVSFIVPVMLVFYGLSLFNAANYTFNEIRYLGLTEIILGLMTAFLPEYSLWSWALGFGVLHILYGTIMYFKYDRENSAG